MLHSLAITGAKTPATRTSDINEIPIDIDADQDVADQPTKAWPPTMHGAGCALRCQQRPPYHLLDARPIIGMRQPALTKQARQPSQTTQYKQCERDKARWWRPRSCFAIEHPSTRYIAKQQAHHQQRSKPETLAQPRPFCGSQKLSRGGGLGPHAQEPVILRSMWAIQWPDTGAEKATNRRHASPCPP